MNQGLYSTIISKKPKELDWNLDNYKVKIRRKIQPVNIERKNLQKFIN